MRGFTLIELIVIIAIIGVLTGIVFATLSSAREKGQKQLRETTTTEVRGI